MVTALPYLLQPCSRASLQSYMAQASLGLTFSLQSYVDVVAAMA